MYRDADCAGLVSYRPADGLPNPPGGIRAEFITPCGIEFRHRPQQTDIALLDQIEECAPPANIPFRYADHQAQVRPDDRIMRLLRPVPGVLNFILQDLVLRELAIERPVWQLSPFLQVIIQVCSQGVWQEI